MQAEESVGVCVIGGGPAGMIAAGRAAELGADVVLLEKNPRPGRKLLMTGGGRCNVTNAEFRRHVLVEKYGPRGESLHSLFARFGPADLIGFLAARGLGVVIEDDNRVFPETHSAASVLEVLTRYMADGGVRVRTAAAVVGLEADRADDERARQAAGIDTAAGAGGPRAARVSGVRVGGALIRARKVILATGGLSRPETGSSGDGLRWLAALGHAVRYPEPSLVPVRVEEEWIGRLQGLAIPDARLTALPPTPSGVEDRSGPRRRSGVQLSERGKLLFTHFGLSGPLVLNMSSRISELAHEAGAADERVRLLVDLMPATDHGSLDQIIRDAISAAPNRKVRNTLPGAIPARLSPVLLELARVDPDLPANSLRREARHEIVQLMKALPLTFAGVLGTEKAVVTSGGVALDEIDFRTMQSRLYENLYFAGDILDFDRRSGGYSLQICWSSGWVAGSAAAAP